MVDVAADGGLVDGERFHGALHALEGGALPHELDAEARRAVRWRGARPQLQRHLPGWARDKSQEPGSIDVQGLGSIIALLITHSNLCRSSSLKPHRRAMMQVCVNETQAFPGQSAHGAGTRQRHRTSSEVSLRRTTRPEPVHGGAPMLGHGCFSRISSPARQWVFLAGVGALSTSLATQRLLHVKEVTSAFASQAIIF